MYRMLVVFTLIYGASIANSVGLTVCDDVSLVKQAFANNGFENFENYSKDTLIMNSWKC